jgi:hypothetical protein
MGLCVWSVVVWASVCGLILGCMWSDIGSSLSLSVWSDIE